MIFDKTIFKKDTKGKIRFLKIITDRDKLIQISGLLGGTPIKHERVCMPKNVGKANETSGEDQAQKEALAKYKDKLSKGYFMSKEEAEDTDFISPMLAESYKKFSDRIDWTKNVYAQPKLDGMRCLAYVVKGKLVKLESRDGKEITTMWHIHGELNKLKGSVILDGELYAHGYSFQENMKMIKKFRIPSAVCNLDSTNVKFHIYDTLQPMTFKDRLVIAKNHILTKIDSNFVELVKTFRIKNESELQDYHIEFLSQGYEGTIVRHGDDPYKVNGRSKSLLKYKDFRDIACKIVSIGPAKKRPTWGRPVVEWNGVHFACSTKMSHKEREELLTNRSYYIGQTAEVRYFEESDLGVPRFPVMVGIRLDK